MKKRFVSKKENCETYTYYSVDGTKITIHAGENGVTPELIRYLNANEYKAYLEKQKEQYQTPVRIGKDVDEYQNVAEKNPCLIDTDADPLKILMEAVMEQEHARDLEKLTLALDYLTPKQKQTVYKKFYLNKTNVAIALEEGVKEGAIRHRLSKIYEKLSKNISKF